MSDQAVYVGNFKFLIDCDALTASLLSQQGDRRTADNPYANSLELDPELLAKKHEMRDNWQNAGYMDSDSVEWINYYAGAQFDSAIVDKFAELVNAEPHNVWISSMMPGKCVPWHWDIIKDYQTHKNNPQVVRYSFFIDKPAVGKIFVLNDQPFHMVPQGDVYKWVKWDEWHLGFNCGFTQKFLFHFIGFDRGLSKTLSD